MEQWIKAKANGGTIVYLNPNNVKRIVQAEYAGHNEYVALTTEDETFLLLGDLFKCSIVDTNPLENTEGSTRPLRVKAEWHDLKKNPKDVPPDDVYVNVCTYEGAVYVSSATKGKFMPNIRWWTPLPEAPKELQEESSDA